VRQLRLQLCSALRYVSAPFSSRPIRHEAAELSRYQVEPRSAVVPLIPPCRPLFLRAVTRARARLFLADSYLASLVQRRGKSKQAVFVLVTGDAQKFGRDSHRSSSLPARRARLDIVIIPRENGGHFRPARRSRRLSRNGERLMTLAPRRYLCANARYS